MAPFVALAQHKYGKHPRPPTFAGVWFSSWGLVAGLDETASGMDVLKHKMKALLPKKEPKQKLAIVLLSLLLMLLLFLVAYT